MIVKEAIERLNLITGGASVFVSDYTDNRTRPCCVRLEGDKVVVDFVNPVIASLNQPNLSPLNVYELRDRLKTLNKPSEEIVFSDYNGQIFQTHCVRIEGDSACFDIDGVV